MICSIQKQSYKLDPCSSEPPSESVFCLLPHKIWFILSLCGVFTENWGLLSPLSVLF